MVKEFAGVLSHQLLHCLDDDEGEEDNESNIRMTIGGQETVQETCVSSVTRSTDSAIPSVAEDNEGNKHELVKLDLSLIHI